jgi:hypothetical protein
MVEIQIHHQGQHHPNNRVFMYSFSYPQAQ